MNRSQGKKLVNSGSESLSRKKEQVRSFLESSSGASTCGCIEVGIESLKKFLEANVPGACTILSDILDLKRKHDRDADDSNWKCWACIYCEEGLRDSECHLKHILEEHWKLQLEDVDFLFRESLHSFPPEWVKNILGCSWKPIDVSAVAIVTEGTPDWDVSLVAADMEREKKLLEAVGALFQTLLRSEILHISHVDTMLDYAMANLPSSEVLKKNGVDRNSTLCFRCLEASQLEHVRDFLNNLLSEYNAGAYAKVKSAADDDDDGDKIVDPPGHNTRLVLDDSRSTIRVYADDWFLPSDNSNDSVSYNLDSAALISWLYDEPPLTVEVALESWISTEQIRYDRCATLMDELKVKIKELSVLHGLNERWQGQKNALAKFVVIQSFEEERNPETDHSIQSFKEVLEGWKELLSKEDSKDFTNAIEALGNRDDSSITKAVAKERDELKMKLHLNAAKVQKSTSVSLRLKERVGSVSVLDYLTVVIPMVKTFLRAKIDATIEQDKPKPKRKSSKRHK